MKVGDSCILNQTIHHIYLLLLLGVGAIAGNLSQLATTSDITNIDSIVIFLKTNTPLHVDNSIIEIFKVECITAHHIIVIVQATQLVYTPPIVVR